MSKYGALADLVSVAGALIAAAGALTLTWKGRANWEPSEQDVPQGAQKVGGLVIGVVIASIWFWLRNPAQLPLVTKLSIILALTCVAFLLAYGLFIAVLTYDQEYAISATRTQFRKIIGGFWRTAHAKEAIQHHNVTMQDLLKGAAYDPDKVWPRLSRALAKMCFIICYLGLILSGTVALCCAAILISSNLPVSGS